MAMTRTPGDPAPAGQVHHAVRRAEGMSRWSRCPAVVPCASRGSSGLRSPTDLAVPVPPGAPGTAGEFAPNGQSVSGPPSIATPR